MAKSKLEINVANAIAAALEINRVTELEPPINAVFETTAKGKELTAARTEFLETITKEIVEVLVTKFDDGYAVQPGDIPNMNEETQLYVKEVLAIAENEAALARLFPVAKKKAAAKKAPAEKSRYGHRVGSMSGIVDDCVFEGSTMDEIVAAIVKGVSGKSESAARAKAMSHIRYLPKARGVAVAFDEETGVYKADKESI